MAYDRKYGRVTTERGTIGYDEPVVVFRSQDQLLPQVLEHYIELCVVNGVQPYHRHFIQDTMKMVQRWQSENPTKLPDTNLGVG